MTETPIRETIGSPTSSERRTVSVVIPTYGKCDLLEQTIESLRIQTYPSHRLEIIIVDDHSTDRTVHYLASLAVPQQLVVVRHGNNRGRAAARNSGIHAATGDLIVFVDDDMRCEPDLVERHVAFHTMHPGAIVIGSALQATELGHSTALSYLDEMGVHKILPGMRAPARYFVTNNSSVARQDLLDVGLFDETFRNYGFEDTELAFRLEDDAGLATWYCAGAIAYHLHDQSFDDVLDKRIENAAPLRHLLSRHPDRAGEMMVDMLLPRTPGDTASLAIRKIIVSFASNRLFYLVIRAVARAVWLRGLSLPVMTYLIACQYRTGLRAIPPAPASAGDRSPL
ncbi:glycosyltransferase [bacterium]|nr:glycosyltransferase [bacterium]